MITWEYTPIENDPGYRYAIAPHGGWWIAKVANVAGEHGGVEKAEANARLIAKAPEMLAALQSIRMQTTLDCEGCRHVWTLANKTIEGTIANP